MMTADEIERYSVERERRRYSDAELWAWLRVLHQQQIEALKLVSFAYYLAHREGTDRDWWQLCWRHLCRKANDAELADLIVWHLTKRGDANVAEWVQISSNMKHCVAVRSVHEAWRVLHG